MKINDLREVYNIMEFISNSFWLLLILTFTFAGISVYLKITGLRIAASVSDIARKRFFKEEISTEEQEKFDNAKNKGKKLTYVFIPTAIAASICSLLTALSLLLNIIDYIKAV